MVPVWKKLTRSVLAFARGRGGNVAVIFAFATFPILAGIGAAIDYSRANSVKTALQAALDTTALMLAKEAATDTATQLTTNGQNYLSALFVRPGLKAVLTQASYTTTDGSAVLVKGSVSVPTTFMAMFGYNQMSVAGSSTAKWGSATRLRVALVLDNTGSMAEDGKMTALQSATKSLLDQLQAAASKDGDVYVSIIPFSKDVNIGTGSVGANWLDWTDWDNDNKSCQGIKIGNFCIGKQAPADHSTWNGCITDRGNSSGPAAANYDQNVTTPNPTITASLFPTEQYSGCPLKMMGLSYDWASMKSLVGQMFPNGNTNQPIGLVWGWQSLVGGGPLTAPPMDPKYQYQQIIILLSDGLNTQNRWSSKQSDIDKRMYDSANGGAGTCANINKAGITLYTIQVNTGGDPLSTLLQNCAGSPGKFPDTSKFVMLTSSGQILDTFTKIGNDLTQLRVAQ